MPGICEQLAVCSEQVVDKNNMLLRFAKSRFGQFFVGFVFAHLSFLLPVKRLDENKRLIVFQHPKPDYSIHYLIVPKRKIKSLEEIKMDDHSILIEVFKTADSLVQQLGLRYKNARLVVNAGEYQEVPQLHFHLIASTNDLENN